MTFTLSRRTFGLVGLAAASATFPRIGLAQSSPFTNPQLLMQPEHLQAMMSSIGGAVQDASAEGVVVIDVRPHEEYRTAHIPGAVHLDPNAVVADQSPVEGTLQGVAKLETLLSSVGVRVDRRIVFYDDRGGFHAARMLWLMEYLGHRNVAVLNGGWSAWTNIGAATQSHAKTATAGGFEAALSPRRHASAEDVLAHRDIPNGVLIDVRPGHLFDQGHIPWAVNIPWSANLDDSGKFRPADDLMAHFATYGVTPDKDVIMHCQVGLASSHSYLALRLLGFPRVRVYHRSWAEWGNDPDLPKAVS